MTQSPEITGGTGFNFEAAVAGVYLAALLAEDSAPGLNNRIAKRVALQQKAFGEPLDDVIVDAKSVDGEVARLSLQVKRNLTISAAKSNGDFREIVENSWLTFKKVDFRENIDRYGSATGTISDASYRELTTVCELARASLTSENFFKRFTDDGNAGQKHLEIVGVFRTILNEHEVPTISDDDIHRFLKHFLLIKLDFLHEGATEPPSVIAQLRRSLVGGDSHRAPDLWSQIVASARDGAGRSEEFSRSSLLSKLAGAYRFSAALSLRADLDKLTEWSRLSIADITVEIDGYHLARTELIDKANSLLMSHRFVQVRGLPGTGKSAHLRELVSSRLAGGSVLFLKSDRLSGRSWREFANSIGLSAPSLEELLVEIASTGTAILFIDGIDRVQPAQRNIITDLVNTILKSPLLSTWHIAVTSRDVGIEPLRSWLPSALFSGSRIGTVDVEPLNDEEATELAQAKPALRPLLFGTERVKEIARRPFFASVLARGFSATTIQPNFEPQSEIDLIKVWWERGGYQAEASETFKRQNALEELAKASAQRQGLRILRSELSALTIAVLHDLVGDEIIRETEKGVAFKFSHDIFFEWSFYYLLRSRDDKWIDSLIGAGEPPVLGRVVELLSQLHFASNSDWLSHLYKIEASSLRPQWQRAWLLGPFGAPDFGDRADTFELTISKDNYGRLSKLFVWFQAEKTIPNPAVLSGQLVSTDLSKQEVIRLADLLGWPSDFRAWRRLLTWVLDKIDSLPCTIIPSVVSTFEVWQNALADTPNPISRRIVERSLEWLMDIEDRRHPEDLSFDYGKWKDLARDDADGLEKSLRMLVLRSARTSVQAVDTYLDRLRKRKHLRSQVFSEILEFAPLLAQLLPDLLIELTRAELIDELPKEADVRQKEELSTHVESLRRIRAKPESERTRLEQLFLDDPGFPEGRSHHHWEWESLAIGRNQQGFFPASPRHEPFYSLFQHHPQKGLALVREITNHAITAWRQLHEYDGQQHGTPIPTVIDFPWGAQEFWGDWPHYSWFRGLLGPDAVECGLMALENWAFREIENGRSTDDVLSDVIQGHECWSVLGIASAIALETKHVSKTTLALLTCQRLWHIDIRRQMEDLTGISANLIGFTGFNRPKATEQAQFEAVRAANARKCRKMSLRDLTPLFTLSHDEEIRRLTRLALERFPEELPFSYEEEKRDAARVQELCKTAEIWAEWGKQENYSARPNPEDEKSVLVELENPRTDSPEIQAEFARQAVKSRELALWNWVQKTFESKTLCRDLSLSDAIETAKQFDRPDLFSSRASSNENDILLGAVAGVAAAVFCFPDDLTQPTLDWASDVIARANNTPEVNHELYSSRAIVPWHPCLFVARAIAARIQQNPSDNTAKEALLTLAGHPLEQVSLEALSSAFECWDADNRFAWTALDLGLRLSIGHRRGIRSGLGYDPTHDVDSRETAVDASLSTYNRSTEYAELISPPMAWVFEPLRPDELLEGDYRLNRPIWRDPDEFWRWDFAPKVLKLAPVEKIMTDSVRRTQFLKLCEELLLWTLERINPSWKEDKEARRDRKKSELLKWKREFSGLLARVAGHLDAETVQVKFLEPIFRQENELCESFLAPFISLFTCIYIIDANEVRPDATKVFDLCIDRVLQDDVFRRGNFRDGVLYGYDLPYIVRDIFFVSINNAEGAARFANGDWKTIDIVLPLIDKFVRAAGWVSSVAESFLTLCEHAGKCYPAPLFADQVLSFLDAERLPGWRGTTLPARIAGLIQRYSEEQYPLDSALARKLLRILDTLVDLGDRRSAALEISEAFKDVRLSR